jgi:hypothetical protein
VYNTEPFKTKEITNINYGVIAQTLLVHPLRKIFKMNISAAANCCYCQIIKIVSCSGSSAYFKEKLQLIYAGNKIFSHLMDTGDPCYTHFRYLQFYFSIMRSINILFMAMVESATQAHRIVCTVSLTHPTILTLGY